MRTLLRGWRYLYGENPLHLLAMLGCFALVGYVVTMVVDDPSAWWLLVWFVGAVVGHDLVMFPLYALADQPLVIGRWARRRVAPRHPPLVPAINHVRAPVLGSAVLGLVYLPTITGHGGDAFAFASGHALTDEYENWLLVTGVLFLASAVIYAGRLGVAAGGRAIRWGRRRAASPADDPSRDDASRDDAQTTDAQTTDAQTDDAQTDDAHTERSSADSAGTP